MQGSGCFFLGRLFVPGAPVAEFVPDGHEFLADVGEFIFYSWGYFCVDGTFDDAVAFEFTQLQC